MFKTRHRIKSFDPSLLVRNSPAQLAQTPEAYLPKHTFSDFGFPPQLVNNIAGRNYSTLTPIQDQVIPLLLEGKDVVGLANTGTGKTASFLLPFIKKVDADRSQKVLIMAPTRELAVQIEEELKNFSRQMKIFSALCIGGVSMQGQIRSLYPNPNFVIGTPGRLKDLSLRHKIVFSSFNTVVLDEVDRMLDMGFIHNMTDILSALPKLRQSAFFSATKNPHGNQQHSPRCNQNQR
ncbi:MAG: DEAD/DEAH box helicase family protein [Candidatus Amesbacteria bacterium GW2011_GWA1_46_35]|nr:MAG: DEAD/DEAH box helicase family protein [Candidatus Amesbacteria bacterium GW2011_GWA1_46_35]